MPNRVHARPFFRPEPEEQRFLPECPRVIGGALLWISIQYAADRPQGGINVLDLGTLQNVHHPLPGRPGFFIETHDPGVLLIGLERRLVLYCLRRAEVIETLAHLPEDPRVIINDGIAIPGGAIFGTKDLKFSEPIAALYLYDDATRTVRELRGGQTCSNGKYLHDGLLVDIDTQPKTITEYRFDGELHPQRLIVPPEALPAFPDGLRVLPGGESIIVAYYNPRPRGRRAGAGDPAGRWRGAHRMDRARLAARHLPGTRHAGWRALRLLHHRGGRHARSHARHRAGSGDHLRGAAPA